MNKFSQRKCAIELTFLPHSCCGAPLTKVEPKIRPISLWIQITFKVKNIYYVLDTQAFL